MNAVNELLGLFARSIFSKACALRSLQLSRNQRSRLQRTITEEIRACGGILFPEVVAPEVSEAAHQAAMRLGVNLRFQSWHTQPKFDRSRTVFHWEHVVPVACIQEGCEKADSEDDVLTILRTRLRIAWILKLEDQELTRLGFRSNRVDPDSAYLTANIILIKETDATSDPAS